MNTKKKIRWGILGTGRIAHKLAEAIKCSEDGELYAAASRSTAKAEAFAAEYGIKKAFGSYESLAADPDIDIVYIATPMSSHYDDSMLCMRHGKHVLCEKSVALNSKSVEEMLKFAREKNLFFMEAMWMKCRPAYLKALEWARSGKIGDLQTVRADFCNLVPYDKNDRVFRADCGGGALLDLGVYTITFAADFLGHEPSEIVTSARIGQCGTDFYDSINLIYPGGAFADLSASFDFPCTNRAAVIGSEGSILFGDWFLCCGEVSLYNKNSVLTEKFASEDKVNGYEYEIDEVNRCLASGLCESPLVPHSSTAAVMRIMDACRSRWGLVFPGE